MAPARWDWLKSVLDYDFGVSISYKMMIVKPRNMSTEHKLPRHVSRLRTWSKRRKMDSENTYRTRSPFLKRETRGPVATMVPAPSEAGIIGRETGKGYLPCKDKWVSL